MHVPQPTAELEQLDPDLTPSDEPTVTNPRKTSDASAPVPAGSPDRPWARALRASVTIWVITHVAYAALTYFAFFQSNKPVPTSMAKAFANWGNWDAEWFVWIADHGYTGYTGKSIDEERSAAFFPMYSLLIKLLSYVTFNTVVAAVIIAFAAQIGAFAVLHRLIEREFDGASASRTLWYLIAFPTGFYLGLTYNASLFLLLVVSALYLIRQRIWWGAGLVCAVATATRSSAVLLAIPFLYEYMRVREFQVRRIRRDICWLGLLPVGIGSYSLFCKIIFNDWLKFAHAQALWERESDWPWIGIYQSFKIIFTSPNIFANDVRNLIDLGSVIFITVFMILAFVGPWKYRRDQWMFPVFGLVTLLFVISFPSADGINRVPLLSAGRLSLEVFPAFMIMGRIGRNQTFDRAFCFIGVLIQGLWFTHFLLDHFIG